MSAFSEALAKEQPGGADVHVEGIPARAKTFSQIIAEETEGVDGEGKKNGKPSGQNSGDPPLNKRALQPHDAETAKSPFPYDPNFLASIRPDQAPRFYGALTDAAKLPTQTVNLSDLIATQDRVDPKKVQGMMTGGRPGKALVVQNNGKQYIADGHHGLAAAWLAGKETADVHFKDITPVSNVMKSAGRFDHRVKVEKVADELGLVFGWAMICKEDGVEYFDTQDDHIPEETMLKAAADFMENCRAAKEQHSGEQRGQYVFAFPMTGDICKALGIQTRKTGLLVGLKPDAAMLEKFKSGELSGFSIGGWRIEDEDVG